VDNNGSDEWDGFYSTYVDGVHGPKKTIQNAIDTLYRVGEICIAAGEYREHGINVNKTVCFYVAPNSYGNHTDLNGENIARIMTIDLSSINSHSPDIQVSFHNINFFRENLTMVERC
jgi:hypothetical protein